MAAYTPDLNHPSARHPDPGDHGTAAAENLVILCTAPDEAVARDLAAKLLDEGLAACITMLPGALSMYRWEGKIEQQQEVQMLIKSHLRHQQALMTLIKTHHPYETPELLVLPVLGGDPDYLTWLNASLR